MVKQFVVDYTTETFEPLMEHEVNGLDYKYVYGNDRLSVDIWSVHNSGSIVENGDHIRLYYHMDYLGTADYLTSPVSGRVESWTHYNEWGEITHNAVVNLGQRTLDLVKRYATHDYDAVLDLYYAKARMYDVANRRFLAVDPILEPSGYDLRAYVQNPIQLVQYSYCKDNPLAYIDRDGKLFKEIFGAAAKVAEDIKNAATTVVTQAAEYVYHNVTTIGNAVVNTAKKVGDTIVKAGETIVETGKKVGETIVNVGATAYKAYTSAQAKATSTVNEAVTSVNKALSNVSSKLRSAEAVSKAAEAVLDVVGKVAPEASPTTETLKGIANAAGTALNSAADLVESVCAPLKEINQATQALDTMAQVNANTANKVYESVQNKDYLSAGKAILDGVLQGYMNTLDCEDTKEISNGIDIWSNDETTNSVPTPFISQAAGSDYELASRQFQDNWQQILNSSTKRDKSKQPSRHYIYDRNNSRGFPTAFSDFVSLNLKNIRPGTNSAGYRYWIGYTPENKVVNLHRSSKESSDENDVWTIEYLRWKIRY